MKCWPINRADMDGQWALLMVAGALWCINHPYPGMFEHDARIYSLLVFHWLSPEAYARDPFFLFGAQDRFSLFTPLHGVMALSLGPSNAALALVAAGGGLWVIASWIVARKLVADRRFQAFAVLSCVIWSINYSPNGATFVLNEAFPTARSIAFPLGALALALALRENFRIAMVLALAAFAVHPLLGLWPLLIIVAQRMSDRAVLWAGLAIAAFLVGLHFTGLDSLQRMDPTWESIVLHASQDVFVGPAGTARINETLAWLSLVLGAAQWTPDRIGRWYRLGAAMGASGFLLAQLCSYFFPAVLIVQAQLWRAMWVVVFFGVFALAQVLGTAWRGKHRVWWAIGGLLLVIGSEWCGFILFAARALSWTPLHKRAIMVGERLDARARRFAPVLLAGLIVAVLPGYIQDLLILGNSLAPDFQTGFLILDGLLLAGGIGVGAFLWAVLLTSGIPARILLGGSAVLLVFAILHWDQRPDNYRDWEGVKESSRPPAFGGAMRRGDVVLWPGVASQRVWHELGTASYAGWEQVIGIVFSREKALEMLRRRQRLAIASLAESWPLSPTEEARLLNRYRDRTGERLDETGNLQLSYRIPIQLTGPGMLYACEDPALDWVVSDRPLPQNMLKAIPGTGQPGLWLYSCRELRAAMSGSTVQQQGQAGSREIGESR